MARWALALLLPLAGFVILLAHSEWDVHWENHRAHFWLVFGIAVVNAVLGLAMSEVARRRGDARVFLVSLVFLASSGFLALHALATPGVLLAGKNTGFVVATPVGLFLGGCFAALSGLDIGAARSLALIRQEQSLRFGLLIVLAGWAVWSLARGRRSTSRCHRATPPVRSSASRSPAAPSTRSQRGATPSCSSGARRSCSSRCSRPGSCSPRRSSRWRSHATGTRHGGSGTCSCPLRSCSWRRRCDTSTGAAARSPKRSAVSTSSTPSAASTTPMHGRLPRSAPSTTMRSRRALARSRTSSGYPLTRSPCSSARPRSSGTSTVSTARTFRRRSRTGSVATRAPPSWAAKSARSACSSRTCRDSRASPTMPPRRT